MYFRQFRDSDQPEIFVGDVWPSRNLENQYTNSDDCLLTTWKGEFSEPDNSKIDERSLSYIEKGSTKSAPFIFSNDKVGSSPDPVKENTNNREAELEYAVKILTAKLHDTRRQIIESENNKIFYKSRLDQLISKLSEHDPNVKLTIEKSTPSPPTKKHHTPPAVNLFSTPLTNWGKLQMLAEEYDHRRQIVSELEDQERYFLRALQGNIVKQTAL